MKAVVFYAPGNIRYEDVPDPRCLPEGLEVVNDGVRGERTEKDGRDM